MKFPKHECSLHLHHNTHKGYYETVETALGNGTYDPEDFISPEQKQKAIETGEVWSLQWYPHTPVGFFICLAADLDALMAHVMAEEASATDATTTTDDNGAAPSP
jgi:hypothetical protein